MINQIHSLNKNVIIFQQAFARLNGLLIETFLEFHRIDVKGVKKMKNFQRVMWHFMIMWVITAVGMLVGTFLAPSVLLPISIITIFLLIIVIFIRSIRVLNTILYCIPFLIGITLFWSTQFYIEELGSALVFAVFIGTVVIFISLGIIGIMMKDLSAFGSYLFGALIVLLVFSLIFIFVPVSNTIMVVLAGLTVLVFALYTIYDFNQIKHNYVSEQETVGMALNLYLDFVNIFLRLLEIIWRVKD